MLNGKLPIAPQIAALMAGAPTDPDEKIRMRIRKELRAMVNWAALFGVDIPSAEETEKAQLQACPYIKPHRFYNASESSGVADPYQNDDRRGRLGAARND